MYSPLDYDPFAHDYGSDGDHTFKDKMVKARKVGKCGHCCGSIQIGTQYRYLVQKYEGELHTYKYCADCCAAMVAELEDRDNPNLDDEDMVAHFENRWLQCSKRYAEKLASIEAPIAEYPPLTEEEYSGLVEVTARGK